MRIGFKQGYYPSNNSKNVKLSFFGQFELWFSSQFARTDGQFLHFLFFFPDPLSSISYRKGSSKCLVAMFYVVVLLSNHKEGFELTLYRLLPCYETGEFLREL